jgi:hypothetical protein
MSPAERRANDRRFLQVAKEFARRGFRVFTFVTCRRGVRHRLDFSTAKALCEADVAPDGAVEFSVFTNCLRCLELGG